MYIEIPAQIEEDPNEESKSSHRKENESYLKSKRQFTDRTQTIRKESGNNRKDQNDSVSSKFKFKQRTKAFGNQRSM